MTLELDLENVPDKDLMEIWESIAKEGAKSPAESYGFDEAALISVERMALGYYQATRYGGAASIYGFLLKLDSSRASAWRGLGACAQAMKEFDMAAQSFRQAAEAAPGDLITQVFLGECLCQLGQRDEGLDLLRKAVKQGAKDQTESPYVARARAIITADGGVPPKVVLKREGQKLIQETEAIYQHIDLENPPLEFDDGTEIQWEDIKRNPELMKVISDLKDAVAEGRLTLAEVGGFTDNELDGAYAVACKYAEMGQVIQAMQITGYLIFIDPYKARYYQLVGICMQRMEQYDAADQYYGMAASMEPDDPMTRIYRGEAKIMSGNVDEGIRWVREGSELAQKDAGKHQDLIDRANVLIKQFSA